MKIYFQVIILILFGFQTTSISGQTVFANLNESVSLDESITYGKLDNGLTYYIKSLPEPQDEVNLRFYIKAGSNHQDQDQLNMAHFVEHMAFNSSEHFPSGIDYELKTNKSLNMGMYDIHGTAGAHFTRYSFDAPADNMKALKTGLLWFRGISDGLHLKNEEIDTERGVLIQEFILRTSDDIQETYAKNKVLVHMSPCMENYSNYVQHHETFDSERLKQFYRDWYRPELMVIVIAGKIENVDALEKQIAIQFSDIPPNEDSRELPTCEVLFFNRSPRFIVVEKKLDSLTNGEKVEMELFFRDKKTLDILPSLEGVKRLNKINLLLEIMNNRLRETKEYGSFFDLNMLHTFKNRRTPSSFKVLISSYNNSEKKALQTFIRVLEQVKSYGVTESEFKRAKRYKLNKLENTEVNESRYWQNEIEYHLAYDEALPSDKLRLIKNWVSDYQSSEFNEFVKGIDFEEPDIGIVAPTNHPVLSYREAEIRTWISEVNQGPIAQYIQPEVPVNLMSAPEVENLQELKYEDKGVGESGSREIILANGVKVYLKSFKPSSGVYQNKIMLHGFNSRGALDFPAEDYFSAVNAPLLIRNSGVGDFDKFDLQRHFSTNSLFMTGINLYINNQEAGIKLYADPVDVEQMLQLIYLLFSQPRQDRLAFEDWKVQMLRSYQNQSRVEQYDIRYNIRKLIGDNSGVSRGTERHFGLSETDMERGFEIYKELFEDAQGFTFTITGDFQMDSVVLLVNKYLGNLPSFQPATVHTQNKDVFVPKLIGPVFTQFNFPDSYSNTNFIYRPIYMIPTKEKDNWKEKLLVRVLGSILNTKIWALRTEKGYALYSVGANGKYDRNMKQYEFGATFDCTPEEYPLLRKEFSDIVTELKSEMVPEDIFKGIVQEMQERYETGTNTHRYIHDKLYSHLQFDEAWLDENEFMPYLESITPKEILRAAEKYFQDKYLYEFVMTK